MDMAGAAGTAIARLVGVAAERSAGAVVAARLATGRKAGAETEWPQSRVGKALASVPTISKHDR
jgi:hypothetical protein